MKAPVPIVLVGGFLGAGKTSTIAALARRVNARGGRVGVVTNDQGSQLVDTARIAAEHLDVREVTGACFCCRFDELVERCGELVAGGSPDLILAEPVGSCTDLMATVVGPLRRMFGTRFRVGPLLTLFQPGHGLAILRGGPGALTADVAYVLRKQLEEADAIAINRVDELPFPLVEEIAGLLAARFPGRRLFRTSAIRGDGLDELLAYLEEFRGTPRGGVEVDYDRYARGEAELGWLNASSRASAATRFALDGFLLDFAEELWRRAAAAGHTIAHFKVAASTPRGTAAVSVIGSDAPARLSGKEGLREREAQLTVNARIVADPEEIETLTREALRAAAGRASVEATWTGVECFRPARPQPTWRDTPTSPTPASRRSFLQASSGAVVGATLAGAAAAQDAARPAPRATASKRPQPPAATRVFEGPALSEIAFPLGGIGTGTLSLGGRGQFRDWEIFNRPNKGQSLFSTFVTARIRQATGAPRLRVVEAAPRPPFSGSGGASREAGQGLPHLRGARFSGIYPIAEIDFEDPGLPVAFSLEAFNPFIPHEVNDSSLPVAILRYGVVNRSKAAVDVTLAFSILNPIGYDGYSPYPASQRERFPGFGKNLARVRDEAGLAGLELTSSKYAPTDVRAGSLALVTTTREYSARRAWRAGRRDDSLRDWVDELKASGAVSDPEEPAPTPDGFSAISTLAPRISLAPGERRSVLFVLAWYFPLRENYWDKDKAVAGQLLRNDYGTRFGGAWEVARHTVGNLERLEKGTRTFRDALAGGSLPAPVVDAVSSQMSILRTNTCLLLEGGQFFGFEGVMDQVGCCPMNCTHVWNYEQALAFLFPALERSMRRTDFGANMRADGSMAFRTLVPLGKAVWNFKPAADGQLGSVLKLYREWQISGDDRMLRELWPAAKRALEFAWVYWDAERDGVIEGEQHNTYDIEFYGANSMIGTLYLGALLAGERMARAVGDGGSADEYRRVFASGREKLDRELWSGGYYVQRIPENPTMAPTGVGDAESWHTPAVGPDGVHYQYGDGCLSDQLLGQWFAHVVGLGHLLPVEHVREALRWIYRHNFKASFAEHENTQRLFALDDERGLLVCSWPRGKRPKKALRYAEEVWTGIEYQVAAHLIYEGLVEEGLTIVKAVRDRYDGQRRNPWNEVECGSHYARALASFSLLTALSGYSWSAPERRLGFAPRQGGDFRAFFATGEAWGNVFVAAEPRRAASLSVLHGQLALERLSLPARAGGRSGVVARVNKSVVPAKADKDELVFGPALALRAGDVLEVG